MAHRPTDVPPSNGTSPTVLPMERDRRAAESPPGSRERSESDVSGWNPERDERPEVREGRFHRAAQMRMAQPRTEQEARGSRGSPSGPYGRDDRSLEDAAGMGPGPMMGEHDRAHSLDAPHLPREYRPWDRSDGSRHGADEARGTRGEMTRGARGRPDDSPRRHEERMWEGASGPVRREATGEGYSGLVGLGTHPAPRTPQRGRWTKEPLTAREIMTRQVKSVGLDSSLREVARLMKDEDCGIVPVVDERGRLRGVLTDRDLVVRTLAEGRSPDTLSAREVMTDDVEVVTPDEPLHTLIELMGRRQVRRVPVVERDDRLVGIISMADIATRADHDEELQQALDRISSRRSFWSRLY